MFNPPEKQPEIQPENQAPALTDSQEGNDPAPAEEDSEAQTDEEMSEIPETDVHTMPDKFLKPSGRPKRKGKISWLILGVLAFVVLGGVIAAVVIFWGGENQPPPENGQPAPVINVNLTPPQANENQNENQNENVNQSLDSSSDRDQRRLADISELRSALSLYFKEHELYPNSLNSLLAEFLTIIPHDPEPDNGDYEYTASEDQLTFELTFALEEGGSLGNLKLTAGQYLLTQEGVSTYSELINANTNTNTGLPTIPGQPAEPTKPTIGLDSDGDELTDIEENLYQTNSTLPDSDGDGYDDLAELLNLYDPAKPGGARLLDSELVEVYSNINYNYSLIYPASWIVRSLTADNREVIFTSAIGEFIQVIIQQNPLSLSAYNWYVNQNPGAGSSKLTTLLIDDLPALQSADGLTTYLGAGSNIYIITYNIGTNQQMNFYSTYRLFLETFMFTEPEEPESPAEPESPEETSASRDAKRISDLKVLQVALELYIANNNDLIFSLPASWNALAEAGYFGDYLSTIPFEAGVKNYTLCTNGGTDKYLIHALLENAGTGGLAGETGGEGGWESADCLTDNNEQLVPEACDELNYCLGSITK